MKPPTHPRPPRVLREALANALLEAEREYTAAQLAAREDGSNAARARYATAKRECQALEAMLPFFLGGIDDETDGAAGVEPTVTDGPN